MSLSDPAGGSRESGGRVLRSYGRIERTDEIKNTDITKVKKPFSILRENREKVKKGFSDPTEGSRETIKYKKEKKRHK